MNRTANHARVLYRAEAQQMVTDLGTAIENVISLAAEMNDPDKVLAMDTLVLLNTKRNVLVGDIAWSDRECQCVAGAQRDLETLKRAAAQREGGAQ